MIMKKIIYLFIISFLIFSCEKPSGEGGTSEINGNVTYFTTSYNAQTSSIDTNYYPKAGKDIFIIYSNDTNDLFDDKTETDWNGNFKFEFLRKGDYTVYTYVDSIVVNDVNYDYPVFYHVNISKNNSSITLEDYIIHN